MTGASAIQDREVERAAGTTRRPDLAQCLCATVGFRDVDTACRDDRAFDHSVDAIVIHHQKGTRTCR
jgi:hypothetical protein